MNNQSNDQNSKQNHTDTEDLEINFHQAAVVNEKGEEVAITEEMVQQACEQLEPEKTSGSE